MAEKIIERNIVDQTKDDLIRYAVYVNRKRAIPSIQDGLKCVARRILYAAAHDKKCTENRTIKSASIVGTVLDKYHPHGDSSVYMAMKPMSNWFEINMPLLKGQGNWGTIEGDDPAAMRYTESGVSKFAYDCVIGKLESAKDIVDWEPNYSNSCMEPAFFPVEVPLLLINGGFGIGYGINTSIPKHNINEVLDATLKLLRNPDAEVVLVPDQCMECEIVNTDFREISNTGNGKFIVRGKVEVIPEFTINKYKKHPAIIIKSLPDMTYTESITNKISKLIEAKKLPQVIDTFDKHTPNEMNYIIILKKGSDPNYVKQILYKNTELQKSISVNFEVIDGLDVVRLSYKSYLEYFIEFRKLTKFRYYCNLLQQVKTKLHEKEIFIKICQSGEVDNIIKMIKKQTTVNDKETIEYLIKRFDITDMQASYIIEAGIKKLSPAYLNKYIEESRILMEEYNRYKEIILDEEYLVKEIEEELKLYKKKYGKKRNSVVIDESEICDIPKGNFKIVITENNFIKKVQENESIGSFKNDSPKFVIKGENHKNILLFDDQGKVFKLPIHQIPVSDRNSNGIDIRIIVKKLTSNISTIMYEPKLQELNKVKTKYFISVLTAKGFIKKLDIDDFLAVPPSGIIYSKLDADDYVKSVDIIANGLDVIVYSKSKALRINISEIPYLKRNTKGNKSMDTDEVDGLAILHPDSEYVLVLTEKGKVNKFSVCALPCTSRAKAGSKVIKLGKNDTINYIVGVNDHTDILSVVTKAQIFEFNVNEISASSSISSGTSLIPTKNNNILKCRIIKK